MMYEIFEGNMDRLEKKLTKIQDKCQKYGCEFSMRVVGETYKKVSAGDNGQTETLRFVQVEASGIAKVDGWEFIATIEHDTPTNIIRAFRTEYPIPYKYYTTDPVCEHCNSNRNRKDTYLIRNTETGEFKQVGKSCLRDYTNGLSAEAVAQYISWFDSLIMGEIPSGAHSEVYYNTQELLQYAVEAVNLYGYQKTYDYDGQFNWYSTRAVATTMVNLSTGCREHIKNGFNENREGNKEKAAEVLAFVKTLPDEYGYISNLKTICSKEYCKDRDVGILVSAIACYNRELKRAEEQKKASEQLSSSTWVGAVGDRIDIGEVEVKTLTSWSTIYGVTHLYQMIDKNGNVYTWKTNGMIDRKTVSVKGTVKEHTEFRGVKQTELTRCKLT